MDIPSPTPPGGGDSARTIVVGGLVLDTDPDVDSTGFDAGFCPDPKNLRAPDIAVVNVPDRPGWIPGTPPLAVEYAGCGQDEGELAAKIAKLLERGTHAIAYFKTMAAEIGVPYQSLINLYLRDCATQGRKLTMTWAAGISGDET